jgi:cell division protease FtsH
VASKIDHAIRHIVMQQYERARSLLIQHRTTLNQIAMGLIDKETLSAEELRTIMQATT